ncbi:MAG: ROK family protein [Candidatus Omnitrophica bacterium]|nr:ROK family protein [Candidatus Omnitrophota bacterium]
MKSFVVKEDRLSEKERRNLSILDAIRRGKEVSRAEISKTTDLNIVTISNYVNKYIKSKMVFETGLDISTGGRRPELLKLNCEYGYSIGIDLGFPQITDDSIIVGVVMDLSGEVKAKEVIRKENDSFEVLIEKVVDLTDILIQKTGISLSDVKGIGVGIWGVLDRYKGMVRYAVEEEKIVSYTKLSGALEDRFNVPVEVEHDATLAAFGERWAGIGASSVVENLIFLCSDSSCGFIIRDEIYYGSGKSAGELNINPPISGEESDKKKCWSSYDYGCCMRSRGIDLGIVSSLTDHFTENMEENSIIMDLAGGDVSNISFGKVVEAAEKGDELAKKTIAEAGEYLGAKIAFLVNLFNPEMIIIGRGVEKAGDSFFSSVRKAVRKWAYDESVKIVKIVPTSLGEEVVAVGAAALIIQKAFAKI